jgi:hypothetical protein
MLAAERVVAAGRLELVIVYFVTVDPIGGAQTR